MRRLWIVHRYDRRVHDLRGAVSRLLEASPLEALGSDGYRHAVFTRDVDQSTPFHREFYRCFEEGLRGSYEAFVRDVISPIMSQPFCFQTTPTFRVHLPGNVAVGEFHRDADYAHLDGERNFWVPLTPAWDTNSVWIEDPETTALKPATAIPGEIVQFDALHLVHGNKANDTGSTRVSFDFRCIPLSEYAPTGRRSVSAGRRMEIGDYYKIFTGA